MELSELDNFTTQSCRHILVDFKKSIEVHSYPQFTYNVSLQGKTLKYSKRPVGPTQVFLRKK